MKFGTVDNVGEETCVCDSINNESWLNSFTPCHCIRRLEDNWIGYV